MRHCIYCRKDKSEADFTLEHVIPQFLGGAYVPDFLKTREVCKHCNSNLGLFVDAGFEKNWLVSNRLRDNAAAFFNPAYPVGLPLICMGGSDLIPPEMPDGHVCESWLGPLGEQIYWIRPQDDRLYWFVGGNPRTTKKVESQAYFMFSERSTKNPVISWFAFRDAFEGRRVRKVMCTLVEGADPRGIGFVEPDGLDIQRIEYFKKQCSAGSIRNNSLSMYVRFDVRFLAKVAIGMSYCLFGYKVLDSVYGKELHKALWYREGDEVPLVRANSMLNGQTDPPFNGIVGHPYAVTVLVLPSNEGISINLNIGTYLNWTVMSVSRETLDQDDFARVKDGFIIILFKSLQKGFHLTWPRYLAHKTGVDPFPELVRISELAERHANYFNTL